MSDTFTSPPGVEQAGRACPRCGNQQLRRLARSGFLQKNVYPLFGYYPWECFGCRKTRLLRARGKRVFRRLWDDFDPDFDLVTAVADVPGQSHFALEEANDLQTEQHTEK